MAKKPLFGWNNLLRLWLSISFIASLLLAMLPIPSKAQAQTSGDDWPQIGHDAQHTNFTTEQVDPPYCYTWKWYEAPLANRAQPVVANGRLFIGSMDGRLYARDATTGAPLWSYSTGGPIRNSPAILIHDVITGSYDGFTYALNISDGSLFWKTYTGPSMTAPLVDLDHGVVYVASTDGSITALAGSDGAPIWQFQSGAPILTTPALSQDGMTVFAGNESLFAFALRAKDGQPLWWRYLQGQSLADRYPVVAGNSVIYRSQPLYPFHQLLHEGDSVMDQAGSLDPDWAADWNKVKPQIVQYLNQNPSKQTFFTLDPTKGVSQGIAPILYTYGNNDTPAPPVIAPSGVYVPYRARHGIQTDGGSIHVTSKYDAELGKLDLSSLDIAGIQKAPDQQYNLQFRMTSDEPTNLSMGGDILFIDNWERLGAVDVKTGRLIAIGNVSNDWPECFTQCGEPAANPFFPLQPGEKAYPFPSPRVSEGRQRPGAVIANHMIYWRVIEGGLAGISHQSSESCPAPKVWSSPSGVSHPLQSQATNPVSSNDLSSYVTQDMTTPVANPPQDLVQRLQIEVIQMLQTASGMHLLPYFIQRGFSEPFAWPDSVPSGQSGPPQITFNGDGTIFWQDPGEFLYTMALVYPYLTPFLQAQLKNYVTTEMKRYSPLENLPWNNPQQDWLHTGSPRELYPVPFRKDINTWPPPAVSIQTLYGLWLWSKNTGDWSYAQAQWDAIDQLWKDQTNGSFHYYADLSGLIGYVRIAAHLGKSEAYQQGLQAAVQAMQSTVDFTQVSDYAKQAYLDPRGQATGWSAPAFFGITPEVGRFLRERVGNQTIDDLNAIESGDGVRWWYLTRAGTQAEIGETSFLAPDTAWSHFLAHAYILGDSQQTLRNWLDRSWAPGDMYTLQKLVAAIQAPIQGPDFSPSTLQAKSSQDNITVTLQMSNRGGQSLKPLHIEIVLPEEMQFTRDQIQAPSGMKMSFSPHRLILDGSPPGETRSTVIFSIKIIPNSASLGSITASIETMGANPVVKTLPLSLFGMMNVYP